jgi:hypothetical protein
MEGRLPGAAANHLHPGVNAEVAFTTLRDWAVAAREKRMMGERVAETAKYTRPGQYTKLSRSSIYTTRNAPIQIPARKA